MDNCIATNECEVPNSFGRAVAAYKAERSQANFSVLLSKALLLAPEISEACEYGLCIPAINRIIPFARFKRLLPTRVFKYFFRWLYPVCATAAVPSGTGR